MKDKKYKEIMQTLGMPDSQSLLSALQQVANEVAQEVHSEYRKNNKKLKMDAWHCIHPDCVFQDNNMCRNSFICEGRTT